MKAALRTIVESVLDMRGDTVDRLFVLILFAFTAVIVVTTPAYEDMARTVPLVIGIPTLLMLFGLILYQNSTTVSDWVDEYLQSDSDLFDVEDRIVALTDQEEDGEDEDPSTDARKVWSISLWIMVTFGLILLVGFLPAILAFLLAFYRFEAGERWVTSVAYSVTAWVAIVIVFEVVLRARLHQGLLEIDVMAYWPLLF